MNWKARVVSGPDTCGGWPRVKGTRLTVEFLLGLKAAGWSEEQILANYPHLTREDLQAVFAFDQALIEEEAFLPAAPVA